MLQLNINTDAAVVFTNKLEKLHRSALPVAIRGALNSAAFNTKQKTLQTEAKSAFESRSKNFFKAFSKVDMAKGFNVNTMQATVGFIQQGLKGENNYAVKDLEQQEHGGSIKKRTFIPFNEARVGSNHSRLVSPRNRLGRIQRIVNATNAKGVNAGQRFIKSVIHAGVGGYVLSDFKGKQVLYRVNSLNRNRIGFKLTALYSVQKGRNVNVKSTGFAQRAAITSGKLIESYYVEQAKKQIEKLR